MLEPGGQTICAPIANLTRRCATPSQPRLPQTQPSLASTAGLVRFHTPQPWSAHSGRATCASCGRDRQHAWRANSQTFRLKRRRHYYRGQKPRPCCPIRSPAGYRRRTTASHPPPACNSLGKSYISHRSVLVAQHIPPPAGPNTLVTTSQLLSLPPPERPVHRIPAANRASPPTKNGRQSQRRNLAPRFVRVCTGAGLRLLGESTPGVQNARKRFCTFPAISPGLHSSMAPTRPSSP